MQIAAVRVFVWLAPCLGPSRMFGACRQPLCGYLCVGFDYLCYFCSVLSSRALVLLLTRLWCVALLEQKFVASGFVSYFSCDNKGCYIYDPIGLQLASGNYIGTIPFLIPQPQKTVGCSLSFTVVSLVL